MLRVAFLPTCLPGHVNPTLGVARELVARGHEVTYHLPSSFRPAARATGARFRPLAIDDPALAAALRPAGQRWEDPARRFRLMPLRLVAVARHVLGPLLTTLARNEPDLVVYDRLSVWGRLAAERLQRPAAMFSASYVINEAFSYLPATSPGPGDPAITTALEAFADDMGWMARTYGVPRLSVRSLLHHVEPKVVVFVPRLLQPAAESFDDRYVFVGGVEREEVATGGLALPPAGGRPLAYLSLGTLFDQPPAFRRACVKAFADGRWDVVLAGVPARSTPPAHVIVREHVPQLAVLGRAAVFVTHGGMNSVLEALRRAVPMVVIPQMPEQEVTARRLAAEGAARVLDRRGLTARSLRAAVEAVHDRAHADAVGGLAARAVGGGGAAAADALIARVSGEPLRAR